MKKETDGEPISGQAISFLLYWNVLRYPFKAPAVMPATKNR